MNVPTPHFLLFSESNRNNKQGQWRFVLQSVDGSDHFEAADAEPDAQGERLELLAVVRGLEALPQPSRVTLVTPSKYVNRGLTFGLKEWRSNGWTWEHFGEMVPVKNRDLWQRIDRALAFHKLECRTWRFDLPHATLKAPASVTASPSTTAGTPDSPRHDRGTRLLRNWISVRRWVERRIRAIRLELAQCGTRLLPLPWLE